MTIPRDLPGVLAALRSATVDDAAARAGLDDALSRVSPVEQIVGAFDALKGLAAVLEGEALTALAGAAWMIAAQAWWGRAGEASDVLLTVAGRLPAAPPAEPPGSPPFVIEN